MEHISDVSYIKLDWQRQFLSNLQCPLQVHHLKQISRSLHNHHQQRWQSLLIHKSQLKISHSSRLVGITLCDWRKNGNWRAERVGSVASNETSATWRPFSIPEIIWAIADDFLKYLKICPRKSCNQDKLGCNLQELYIWV